jgi:threonine synthase
MWKAFEEMRRWGWLDANERLPQMIVAQAAGCAPLVRALADGADRATPWENPWTYASGLRVPGPLGDRLVLKTIRASGGDAESATEDEIRDFTARLAHHTGIDAAPEGGAALFVTEKLVRLGRLSADSEVVVYNTGSGASYRA